VQEANLATSSWIDGFLEKQRFWLLQELAGEQFVVLLDGACLESDVRLTVQAEED
jgi:hypothetical protein